MALLVGYSRNSPGILHWALDGRQRLYERGHFIQPKSATDEIHELEDLGSPVGAFVRDRCDVGPISEVSVDELYREWRSCVRTKDVTILAQNRHSGAISGRRFPPSRSFSRGLTTGVNGATRGSACDESGTRWNAIFNTVFLTKSLVLPFAYNGYVRVPMRSRHNQSRNSPSLSASLEQNAAP